MPFVSDHIMWHLRNLALGFSLGVPLVAATPTPWNDRLGAQVRDSKEPSPITIPIKIIRSYYTIELSLGTPPQPADFYFDTGSGPLWVLDPECSENCPSAYNFTRSFYNPNASNTSEPTSQRTTVDYQGGSISGSIWSDTLTIQNISSPAPQRIISTDTSNWGSMAAGGFVGLGFKPLALGNTSIYDALFHPTFLPEHRTGIYLGKPYATTSNPSPETNGVVTFGGSEEETYGSDPLKWVNVLPVPTGEELYAHWRIPVSGVKTTGNNSNGSTATVLPSQPDASAIFDTGAGLISVPSSIIESLYTTLGYNYTAITRGYRPLCSEVLALNSSLTLTFGEVEVTVTAADLAKPGYNGDQFCWPPFNPWDSPNWLIGKSFLQSFYTVWDLGGWNVSSVGDGQPRIGLSYLKEEYKPSLRS